MLAAAVLVGVPDVVDAVARTTGFVADFGADGAEEEAEGRGAGIANAGVNGAAAPSIAAPGPSAIGAPTAIAKSLLSTLAPTSSIVRPLPSLAPERKADK